jgi:uncharacterized ion transporter superfamily protein YfcC
MGDVMENRVKAEIKVEMIHFVKYIVSTAVIMIFCVVVATIFYMHNMTLSFLLFGLLSGLLLFLLYRGANEMMTIANKFIHLCADYEKNTNDMIAVIMANKETEGLLEVSREHLN